MTENSPEPSMICDVMRRMNALSSTTRTRGFLLLENTRALSERAHFQPAVGDGQIDAPSVISARVFGNDRNFRVGEDRAHCGDVTLADIDRRVRDQVTEHARAAGDLRLN